MRPGKPVALQTHRTIFTAMDWQQSIALLIVATAAILLLRSRFRRRKFQFGRDTHCGCSAPGSDGSHPSITYRGRKGEAPHIVVKMK